jgi:archaellin
MKKSRPATSRPKTPLLLLLAAIIVAGVLSVVIIRHFHTQQNAQNNSAKDTAQNDTTLNSKKDIPPATSTSGETSDKVPVNTAATMDIATLSQSGTTIHLDAVIAALSDTSGTCVATFTKDNNKPVVHEFKPTLTDNAVHCATSDISALEFSSLGQWTTTVRYYQGNSQITGTKVVTIN